MRFVYFQGRAAPRQGNAELNRLRRRQARFERDIPVIAGTPFGIAQITLGCCLSYLDFRFADFSWRNDYPNLAAWHTGFRARPSVQATEIVNG